MHKRKGYCPIPHNNLIEMLNRIVPSHLNSFMSLKESILPPFKSYIRVQDAALRD